MSLFYAQSSVCKDAEELTELRQSAADFYRLNHVPEHLERALNELFTRRPSDLHGYLAEFFSTLSSPPRISRVEGLEVLDSRGQPSILAQVYCIIRNHEKVLGSAVKPPPPPEPPELLLSGGLSVGALSLSVARGGAQSRGVALYQHIAMLKSTQVGPTFGALLSDCGAPCLSAEKVEQPLDLLSEACSNLELNLGAELFVGLSCATPNLYDHSKGKYEVSSGLLKTPDEVVDLLQALLLKYPSVVTVIDPLRREDVEQWKRLAASVSESCSLLSDITFRVQAPPPPGVKGHVLKHVNHVTISDLIRVSTEEGIWHTGSGSFVSFPFQAVGLGLDFLKLGGLSGAERTTRFNRLLAIEDELQREGCLGESDALPVCQMPSLCWNSV
uniref:Enolase 4 n=1 Tax=Periophthalmus magnuspinnatus TaxID=409849 RepID=A0A3B4AJ27_9GOBI